MIRAQAQLDDGARVGQFLCLPAILGLITNHRGLGAGVPNSVGLALEILFADQCCLDLAHADRINYLLATFSARFTARRRAAGMDAGRSHACSRGLLWGGSGCRCSCQQQECDCEICEMSKSIQTTQASTSRF